MEDMDLTIPPRRHEEPVELDVTMPGKRDRKPDGRFDIGDLIMKRYKVLAELGQGGMGVVYKCFDETAGIEVALKALPPELSHNTLEMEDIKDNFQLVHNLHHPNIASSNTLEKDNSNGNYYLIMECCEGEDLRRWLRRKRKEGELTLDDVLPIVKQVADALDYAHKMKIIHRDIKPGNIMINAAGEIKVLDFGLAAQIHTSMTRVSMAYYGTSGTGPYMAPEQWEGRLQDAKADQYALAVMTYEMLAGHPPFESTDAAVLREAVLKSTVPPLANVPKSAEAAILRAMSKNPAERFENCSDFAAALGGKKIKSAKIHKKGGSGKWIAAILFFVMLGGIVFYFSGKEEQKPVVPTVSAAPAPTPAPSPKPVPVPDIKPAPKDEKKIRQETYRLQASVLSKKRDIESANHDQGQSFGRYLKELKENYEAGELALKNNDVTAANASFKDAEKAADWININAPLRREAQSLQKEVNNQKNAADKFNASKLSLEIYNSASAKEIQAKKDYESGKFPPAVTALKSALEEFRKAYTESRNLTLDNLIKSAERAKSNRQWEKLKEKAQEISPLDPGKAEEFVQYANEQIKFENLNKELSAARKAKAENNWQSVCDHAVAALKIDSSNSEAQSLKQEAENHLIPTLEIIAYVNGEQVKATVYSLKTLPDRNTLPWKLKKGKEYEFEVTYKDGENEYYGKIPSFTCTANGPHRKDVTLTKVEFNGTITLANGVKLEMVKVEPGTFTMSKWDGDNFDNEVEHQKTLTKPFYIGKFEVTQEQWYALMKSTICNQRDKASTSLSLEGEGNKYPVYYVSWNEAMSFCEKMNQYLPSAMREKWKFTLPTETQWEFAARGGNRSRGYKYSGSDNLNEVGWYEFNSGSTTHEVGKKSPNELGLYDMSGNVWEWCLDNWQSKSNKTRAEFDRSYSDSDVWLRVSRGGAWLGIACRSARRDSYNPGYRSSNLGFRLALVPIQ